MPPRGKEAAVADDGSPPAPDVADAENEEWLDIDSLEHVTPTQFAFLHDLKMVWDMLLALEEEVEELRMRCSSKPQRSTTNKAAESSVINENNELVSEDGAVDSSKPHRSTKKRMQEFRGNDGNFYKSLPKDIRDALYECYNKFLDDDKRRRAYTTNCAGARSTCPKFLDHVRDLPESSSNNIRCDEILQHLNGWDEMDKADLYADLGKRRAVEEGRGKKRKSTHTEEAGESSHGQAPTPPTANKRQKTRKVVGSDDDDSMDG